MRNFKQSSNDISFEIPVGEEKVVFAGRRKDVTIAGKYDYNGVKGSFGLTQIQLVTVESLEKYYGAYRVSPDRVISIFRGWDSPRTLNYVDYKTGQVGTLRPSSQSEFFSGAGLAVSFPVTLRVSFERRCERKHNEAACGTQRQNPTLTARKIEFKEERLTYKNGDITLGGILILPATKGPHPVVIVTPGDYGTTRNQLRMWAHNFVSRGIAAVRFRFPWRRVNQQDSSIRVLFQIWRTTFSWSSNAQDTLDDIDPGQIGLFGFSNSAFIVSLAASRSEDVSFLIMQSFVGVQGWKQEGFRAETQLRVDKFPESVVKQGADFMRLKYEVARHRQRVGETPGDV